MFQRLILLILVTLSLIGCGTTPKYDQVTFTETKVINQKVPDFMTEPCIPNKPPAKDIYLKLKPDERETAMSNYVTYLFGVIKDCNTQLAKIRDFANKQ